MSIPATHRAAIAEHVYDDPDHPVPFVEGAELELDGKTYKILKIVDDPHTHYQGAIYQDVETGEFIVAHRGTELALIEPALKDGGVDALMVAARVNLQTPVAEALTQEAIKMSQNPRYWPDGITAPPAISHTGHSLGGYHAERQAARHGHGGASFNAFGAAGIDRAPVGVIDGAPPFTAYVRASDPVGTASRHYGDVVHFATERDIEILTTVGQRTGIDGPVGFLHKAGVGVAEAHTIKNFTEQGLMTEVNRNRYLDHQPLFEEHTRAVHHTRDWMSSPSRVAERTGEALLEGAADGVLIGALATPGGARERAMGAVIGAGLQAGRDGRQAFDAAIAELPPIPEPFLR